MWATLISLVIIWLLLTVSLASSGKWKAWRRTLGITMIAGIVGYVILANQIMSQESGAALIGAGMLVFLFGGAILAATIIGGVIWAGSQIIASLKPEKEN